MQKGRSASDFEIISRLGEGAFGQVFKVKRKQDGEIYAMKKIKTVTMKQKDRQNALNQIRILASMNSQNIIGYKDSFYDEGSTNLCIVLQFAEQGDIMKKITQYQKKKKFIEEPQIWKAMVQIAKGMKSLHDKNILHRDLKSANIFISKDGTYKLGDLNISKVLKQGLARTQTGTPYYCSPEVWQDKPYGAKSDIWSFGCVLYQMATQKPPFTATDIQGLFRKICAGVFSRIPNHYSTELSDIINSMLKLNPSLRPSTDDILNNPIVQKRFGQKIQGLNTPEKANLLKTIQFNKKGWKNLNSNLPKSQYQQEDQCNQQAQKNFDKPKVRLRQLASKSQDNFFINQSIDKRNQSRQPSANGRRDRVLSAHGKNPNPGVLAPQNKNKLVLPPIDPRAQNRSRRGSDVAQNRNLPPKPEMKRDNSRGSMEGNRNNSRDGKQRLQKAGQAALNNNAGLNYRINNPSPRKNY